MGESPSNSSNPGSTLAGGNENDYAASCGDSESSTSYKDGATPMSLDPYGSNGTGQSNVTNNTNGGANANGKPVSIPESVRVEKEKSFDFSVPDSDKVILFRDPEKTSIKACSLAKLIEKMTISAPIVDVDDFLLTYRSFCGPDELLACLFARYHFLKKQQQEDKIDTKADQLRVFLVFRRWVEKFVYDFEKEPASRDALDEFLQLVIENESENINIAKMILSKLDKKTAVVSPALDAKPSGTDGSALPILEYPSVEIAQQLTLLDWQTWSRIQNWELLGLAWTKKDRNERAPNVVTMTARFNQISNWVASVFVTTENLKQRIKILKKFIDIADHLKAMGNYNGFMEVFSALQRGPCRRMKKAFEGLDSKVGKKFDELFAITDCTNHVKLRDAISSINPPVIPYLGMYLSDILFTNEGNPDYINGLINFFKCVKCSETIKRIKQYQLKGYNFVENKDLQNLLLNQTVYLDEETLYDISYYLEPREGKEAGPRPAALGDYLKKVNGGNAIGDSADHVTTSGKKKDPTERSAAMVGIRKERSFSFSSSDPEKSREKRNKDNDEEKKPKKISASNRSMTERDMKASPGKGSDALKDTGSTGSNPNLISTSPKSKTALNNIRNRSATENILPDKETLKQMKKDKKSREDHSEKATRTNSEPSRPKTATPRGDLRTQAQTDNHLTSGIKSPRSMEQYGLEKETKFETTQALAGLGSSTDEDLRNDFSCLSQHSPENKKKNEVLAELVNKMERNVYKSYTDFPNLFLALFRSFATPREVIDELLTRFEDFQAGQSMVNFKGKSNILRLVSIFEKWIRTYSDDFTSDVTPVLLEFAKRNPEATHLKDLLEQEQKRRTLVIDYAPITMRLQQQGITLIQYAPMEVAQQMTLDVYERVLNRVSVKAMTQEVDLIRQQLARMKFDANQMGDVQLLSGLMECKASGVVGIVTCTNEKDESFFKGQDVLNWFQRIVGFSPDEIKQWTSALTQPPSPFVKRFDVTVRSAFEFEKTSLYAFCKPPADVFFSLGFRTDNYCSETRKLAYAHLTEIKNLVVSTVEIAKIAHMDLALKTLNHIFLIARALLEIENWHSFVGVISGLHHLINNENRSLWNSISFADLQWFFKMRKIVITPPKLDEAMAALSAEALLYLPRVLDQLQLAGLESEDEFLATAGAGSTSTINALRFVKFGRIIESFMKAKCSKNQYVRDDNIQALFRMTD